MNVMKAPEFDNLLKDDSHLVIIESVHRRPEVAPKQHLPHRHPFFSIELMCSGEANQYVNGEYYDCKSGSAFLFSPFDEHMFEYINDEEFHLVCLYFGEDALSTEVLGALDVDCTPYAAKLSPEAFDEILRDINLLKHEYAKDDPFRKTMLQSLANKIIISLLRSSKSHKREVKNNVQGSVAYIRRHFRENLTLEQIAKTFYVTPNHFCKYFKKYTGQTFKDYLNNLRCDYALKQIETTAKSITDISFESGFASPSYFTKIFTRKFGKKPSNFR